MLIDLRQEPAAAGAGESDICIIGSGAAGLTLARRLAELGHDVTLLESGGLTLEVAKAVGETGVDYIAVGELTHSARVLDIGLDLEDVLA